MSKLEKIYSQRDLTGDVKLICADGTSRLAHMAILMSLDGDLSQLLHPDPDFTEIESPTAIKERVIDLIPNGDVLDDFLRYCYFNEIQLETEGLYPIIHAIESQID